MKRRTRRLVFTNDDPDLYFAVVAGQATKIVVSGDDCQGKPTAEINFPFDLQNITDLRDFLSQIIDETKETK